MKFRGSTYVTQIPAVHFACCALGLMLLVFAVWPPPTEEDMLPLGDVLLTYGYTLTLFIIALSLVFSRHVLNWSNGFLSAPLLLSLISCVALIHARSMSPMVTTYSSALIPFIICALPMMISTTDFWLDCRTISKFLLFVFCLTSFSHLAWQFSSLMGVTVYPSLEQTFTFCFAMLLAGFARRYVLLTLVTVGAIASLALRPTSTLFIGIALAMAAIVAYRMGSRRLLRFSMISSIILMLLANLGILASADFARLVYSSEPYVKQSVLNSRTDNEFRLGVIDALRSETEDSSIIFGKYFTGNVNPIVTDVLPWWFNESQSNDAPIHSDFLIMLSQGGLVGYLLFAVLLLGFARLCTKGARLSARVGDAALERFFDAALVMEVIFCFYIMFNPILQKPYIGAFFLVMVPICVFLMRGLEHALSAIRPIQQPVAFGLEAVPGS